MFKNTKEYFQEYLKYLKDKDNMKLIGLSFQFPIVIIKDFKSMNRKQLIIGFSLIVGFSVVISQLNNKINSEIEQQTLQCDCSMERNNDHYYYYWYTIGLQYGERIPQIVNVSRISNNQSPLGKSYFTTSWIKDWIFKNGGQNIGGVPNNIEYKKCWEKGFLIGRNNYLEK